jgi:hypothetical protein
MKLSLRIFLIVAATLAASIAHADEGAGAANAHTTRFPHAATIYTCPFDPPADPLREGWPDGWTRERSAQYPRYLEVKIDSTGPAAGERSLRMTLNGGAALAYSPTISVSPLCSYVFEVQVKTESLLHNRAFASVTFYDRQNNVLERDLSATIEGTTGWTRVQIGPVAPRSEEAAYAKIGLHLEPQDEADLQGSAWFANVWAARLPRVQLQADSRTHLYALPQQPEVTCTASGYIADDLTIVFDLIDVDGRVLQQFRRPIKESAVNDVAGAKPQADEVLREGKVVWRPPLPDVGYYRVRATIDGESEGERPEVALTLIRAQESISHSEFGWAFSRGERPLGFDELADVARHGGISWLKFPLWQDDSDKTGEKRNGRLESFVDQLKSDRIAIIGLLNTPPAGVLKKLEKGDAPLAAQVFSAEPDVWYPSLEPTITRFASSINWWQLGGDGDYSFVNYPKLDTVLATVRKQFEQFGHRAKLGVPWSPLEAAPPEPPLVNFVSLDRGTLPNDLIDGYLKTSVNGKLKRFVNLSPTAATNETAVDRAGLLAQQILSAKRAKADGIFMEAFESSDRGLLRGDGTIGEAFLPWRTAALMLGGADDIGTLRLPSGSSNYVFARDGQLIVMLWNAKASEEVVALGPAVRRVDLWGRTTQPPQDADGKSRVAMSITPVFLIGLSEPLARFQMAANITPEQWSDRLGEPLNANLQLKDFFSKSASGTVRIVAPPRWRIVPRVIPFKLSAGQAVELPFEAMLPFDCSAGPQELQLQIELAADRYTKFTVYRSIIIGNNDVSLEVTTHLSAADELIVEQKLVNRTVRPVSYRCSLFIPDRKRMMTDVINQGLGVNVQTYTVPWGGDLIGKQLWIRADEENGQRILNSHFEATK